MSKRERSELPRSYRRVYVVQGAVMAGVLGLGVAGVVMSLPASASLKAPRSKQARPDSASVDEDKVEAAIYSLVMRLRRDIALTNDDLAALGLDQPQAADLLGRLVEWVEANHVDLMRAENTAEAARRELTDLQRRIRVGEADEREARRVDELQEELRRADAACHALCTQAGTHALAPAPRHVQTQWQTACRFCDLPLEVRHIPNLNDRRLQDLVQSVSAQIARSQASNSRGAVLRASVPASTRQAMDTVRRTVQAHLHGVQRAEQEVLPLPEELRDDEATLLDGVEES